MTLKLKEGIRKKAKLYKLHLKDKISKTDYVYFKNKLTNILSKVKRLYYARVFLEAAGNSNKIWFTINSIMERKKVTFIESMKVNGVMLYERELANNFNNHFAAAASLIRGGLSLPLNCLFYAVPILESSFIYPTNSQEVLKILRSLKNKGSKLLDIPPQIIKENSKVLSSHFAELYNISLREMVFPSILKIGKITHAHKSGSTDDADNCRPITTLPALSKIFERLTLNRMDKFIVMHSLHSPSQFGFCHGKGTTHAIIKLLSHATSTFHKKIYCVSFFLDLHKAFDTTSHRMLLQKLCHYGFRGQYNEYLKFYFQNRKQYVYLNGHSSEETSVISGVPQGSILGPLCFSLFINDLPMAVDANTVLFADDAAFIFACPNLPKLFRKLDKLFADLTKYLTDNGLVANSSKCKLMMFNFRRVYNLPDFVFSGGTIEWVNELRYLGLTLTNTLTYAKHVSNVSLNISRITGALAGIRDIVPLKVLIKLYSSLALPSLMHHIIIWGSGPRFSNGSFV